MSKTDRTLDERLDRPMLWKDPFSVLEDTKEHKIEKFKKEGKAIMGVDDLIDYALEIVKDDSIESPENRYKRHKKVVESIEYTMEDIDEMLNFELLIKQIKGVYPMVTEKRDIGIYVMALMNKLMKPKNVYHINTRKCGIKMDYLGMYLKNGKKLVINGSAGLFTGYKMKGGEMLVKGSCGMYTGKLMEDGMLTVFCQASAFTGEDMRGGILKIEGNVHSFGDRYGGTVIWKGNKV